MSVSPSNTPLKELQFYSLLQEGVDRMLSVVQSDKFEFIVKGDRFSSTLAEAVLISPKVYEIFQTDQSIRTFTICEEGKNQTETKTETVESSSFKTFLECFHLHDFQKLSQSEELSFLSICRILGNERLAFLILASLNSHSTSTSTSSSSSSSSSSISPDILLNLISSSEATINYCASKFESYSIDEIVRLDKQTLHHVLGSSSLRVESEDHLLKFLIDLGSDYYEFWNYLEPIFLTADGILLFGNTLPFDHVTEDLWKKVFIRIADQPDEKLRIRRYFNPESKHPKLDFGSAIVSALPPILKEFETKTLALLYRGTRDGFSASNFHAKCDQQSNTLTIILTTEGYIFGGFSPAVWDSTGTNKADNTGKSFLFSLKNPRNSEPKIFPISNQSYSICCHSSYGPSFGSNCDIYVADNCNQNASSHTLLGGSYRNDTEIANNQVFTGQTNFQVKEIEVFSISS
jgi:hypothetical protein